MNNHDFEVLHWSYSYQMIRGNIRILKHSKIQTLNIKHVLVGFNPYTQKTVTDYLGWSKTDIHFCGFLYFS